MKSAKDKVLAGEKGEHVHVPASKRGNPLTPNHKLWLNSDVISKTGTSGTNPRRAANSNSTKTK